MSNFARLALLPIAILQIAALVWSILGTGEPTSSFFPPERVLPIFQSIWGAIALLYLAFAVVANLKPEHVADRLSAPLALAGLGCVVWMVSAQMFSLAWLEMLILIPVLLCAWEAAYRLDVIGGFDGTGRRLLTCTLVGLLAGWLVITFATSLPEFGRSLLGRGVTDAVWHSLWLALIPIAALAWLFASKVSRNVWFFTALGWGLLGIAANNWLASETHGLAIAAIIVAWIVLGRRLRYGASGSSNER